MKVHGNGAVLNLVAETATDERALEELLRAASSDDTIAYTGDRGHVEVFAVKKVQMANVHGNTSGDAELTMSAPLMAARGWKPGDRVRAALKARVVKAAMEKGHTAAEAETAYDEVMGASDRPFLDWLMDGGFEKLLALVLKVLDILA